MRDLVAFSLLLSLILLSACKREAVVPTGVAVEDAQKNLADKFAQASGPTKELSKDAGDAMTQGHYSDAYQLLNQLSSKPDLSATEREAAAQAQIGLMKKLQESAANGDKAAAELIEHHRASK